MATLVVDIGQLLTLAGPKGPRRGASRAELGLIADGAVLIEGGKIRAAGPRWAVEARPAAKRARRISAGGGVVLPGFVDAHTHPVFAAPRLADFEARVGGASYAAIAASGGGILSSVRGARRASEKALAAGLARRARDFLACGTTTIEAKSGYGLDLGNELKLLRVLRSVGRRGPLEIVPTLLAAHAVPPERGGDKDGYVAEVCKTIIPAAKGLARFVDIFCDAGYFDLRDLERIAAAGAKSGLGLKVHSEQLSRLGSVAPALRRRAVTLDHLDHAAAGDVAALARSATVACLVPGSNYFLGKPYPPARRLLDAGGAVALATDFNPGSCPCLDMRLILSIACTQMRMTPAEGLVAATINGAHAAGLGKTHGSLEKGKLADLVCFEADDWRELGYWIGGPRVRWTMKRGALVRRDA